MTKQERLSLLLQEVRALTEGEDFQEGLKADARMLRDHPSSAEGDAFLAAALADLAEELDRLEGC